MPPKKRAVPTSVGNKETWVSSMLKENTFWLFEVFLKHKADVKDEMTFVIERKVIVKKSDL